MVRFAGRIERIQPFHVMALLERAKQLESAGHDVIHLEVGEPDFPTPEPILVAGQAALASGHTRYTPAAGLPALRQAISRWYADRFEVTVSPRRILVTPGASGALGLVTGLLFEPGDEVMLADPGYPCNSNFLHLIGAIPQPVPSTADTGFQLTAELAEAHWRSATAGVWVASPSNPTGTLLPWDALVALHALTQSRNVPLIVDEIYQGLTFGEPSSTALALEGAEDNVYVVNSFSKYFGMTGWRVGWIVAPESAVSRLEKMAQNFFLAAPTPSQYAALAAFHPDTLAILEARRGEIDARRRFLLEALPALGIHIPVEPRGAFYVYCDVSAITPDSFAFCHEVLETAHVALTPGIDFGTCNAQRFLRIACTAPLPRLEEAIRRLAMFIGASGRSHGI